MTFEEPDITDGIKPFINAFESATSAYWALKARFSLYIDVCFGYNSYVLPSTIFVSGGRSEWTCHDHFGRKNNLLKFAQICSNLPELYLPRAFSLFIGVCSVYGE